MSFQVDALLQQWRWWEQGLSVGKLVVRTAILALMHSVARIVRTIFIIENKTLSLYSFLNDSLAGRRQSGKRRTS